jgi:hypothetical protein
MKRSSFLAAAFAVLLFACNDKSSDIEEPVVDPPPTSTADTSATLVTKTVLTSGSDITTMNYQYDANKKLVWYSNTSNKAVYFEDTSKIVRDNNGIIKQIIYRSDTSRKYNDPSLDSIVFNVFYDAASSHYTDKISQYKLWKSNFRDSTHYTYDAQNHIVKEESFYFDYKHTPQTYQPWLKNDFTYDAAGNITTLNTVYYKIDSVNDYAFNIAYTYEDKGVNLLNFGNEAIILGMQQNFSAKVPRTIVGTYPETQYNRNFTYKYTYNTKYYPLRADLTDAANGNATSTLTYTYQ